MFPCWSWSKSVSFIANHKSTRQTISRPNWFCGHMTSENVWGWEIYYKSLWCNCSEENVLSLQESRNENETWRYQEEIWWALADTLFHTHVHIYTDIVQIRFSVPKCGQNEIKPPFSGLHLTDRELKVKEMIWRIGKYPHLLSCQRLDEKIGYQSHVCTVNTAAG